MSKLSSDLLKKVFVYGTLKRGEPNHYWLTRNENGFARFVDEGATVERFPLVVGTRYNVPFILDKRGTGKFIKGEVYEVDEKMFANLDILEDYPLFYDREKQTIILNNNEKVECWLYLIRTFPDNLLEKEHLTSYQNTKEKPYKESYLDNKVSDLYEDDESLSKP